MTLIAAPARLSCADADFDAQFQARLHWAADTDAAIEARVADILADAKRGDIGSTMAAYARAWLADDSPLCADAVTASPYLGFGSLQPAVSEARDLSRAVIVLARTSNPEGAALQSAQADPKFRDALLEEGIETLLASDVDAGKAILRDYIKATVGFEQLGIEVGSSPKSLIRMFGPTGNPQARNLFSVISQLQRHAGLTLRVTAQPR